MKSLYRLRQFLDKFGTNRKAQNEKERCMSKYLSFCRKTSADTKKTKNKKFCLNWNCYSRVFVVVVICLIGGYVFLTNFGVAKGFEIANLEKQVNILHEQNKNLVNKVQKMQSLGVVENRAQELNLVSVGKVEYLSVKNGVAMAR